MRQALISLLIYVVPLPVVLFFSRVALHACNDRTYTFLIDNDRYRDGVHTFLLMFPWFDGSLRAMLFAMLVGMSIWALHQSLRAVVLTLHRTHSASA